MYDNVRKPESDWYEAGYTAPRTDTAGTGCYDSYWSPSQAAAPKKKPHQGLKITMIILGVLVLIIASCYVFAGRGRDSISVDGDPGQHGSVTLPREDTDDDTTVTGKNELPTAPTDPGVTMTLQPAGGSALTLQSVYAKCLPSVVGIHADISRSEYSTGTGIVLTADGYIVTNTHVLDGAKAVTVTTSDGTEYTGKLVGADAVSDIAVLKIEAQGLTPAEFGDSSSLQVGDDVVSIGNPLGEQLRWTPPPPATLCWNVPAIPTKPLPRRKRSAATVDSPFTPQIRPTASRRSRSTITTPRSRAMARSTSTAAPTCPTTTTT